MTSTSSRIGGQTALSSSRFLTYFRPATLPLLISPDRPYPIMESNSSRLSCSPDQTAPTPPVSCWPAPSIPSGIAALQDPLHHRHYLLLNSAEPQYHRTEGAPRRTVFRFMTILEENHHSFLIVEYDPLLYEDAREMVEYQGPRPSGRPPGRTPSCSTRRRWTHLQKLTYLADRVFCIYCEQAPAKGRKAEEKMPIEQRTLEAYS